MTLKRQLFVASLLMLLIPWAGLQFVLELDQALRQQALQQLQDQAERLAQTSGDLSLGLPPVAPRTPAIYVENLNSPLNLDGYSADWPGYDEGEQFQPWQSAAQPEVPTDNTGQPTLRWQAATDQHHLYLLIRIGNRQPVFFKPDAPDQVHDRLYLWLEPPSGNLDPDIRPASWLIRTPAPGKVYATVYSTTGTEQKPDYRISGYWHSVGGGWQLELELPKPPRGSRLGFSARWQESPESAQISTPTNPLPILVERKPELERQLLQEMSRGQIVRLVEPAGWVVAQQATPARQAQPEFEALSPLQIAEHISLNALRALVQLYQPTPSTLAASTNRLDMHALTDEGLVRHEDNSVWLMTTQPVFGGRTLVLEQSLDQLLTLSGSALGSVIARSILIIIGLTLVLLGYASWLSWRITRLQRAVNASIDKDGRITGTLPASKSRDELGQLQNHFAQMADRLHGYNRYLESFSRRLSHELKTPVAVVRSSLENLTHSTTDEERSQYIGRAAAATERLRKILNGMSEAARLEQSFDHADKETFDLADVISQATAAYQTLDEHHQFQYTGPVSDVTLTGSPELIVQLLDKLVDNARDFTPPDGRIITGLERTENSICLSVFNEGSALPTNPDTSIFSPFVSVREGREEGHLGQGLLIVQLIADFHNGRVEAVNEAQSSIDGVCFRVIIPATHL
ncbi:histidine kinase dimerization/phospho-acceptor domain-containing protein [Marinobacter sp. 2_MG-2023]|uniref:histidine kinase dimerization/phospho-acceptor domain-containing protein n=1 Tax=Marinobacter sp. 2_MG-2023 TaxID=3062679 RepID=UPI0026E23E69|nr:histidine kinase dimerization/phospho-acceptor domain-containing protein [Marinobacter sp. 2_MG-2023]MDO6441555.1 histidine kinase dimerization/phospho-acceptor domain-containing protein [Marinobacter sp. 2_MG-2023]